MQTLLYKELPVMLGKHDQEKIITLLKVNIEDYDILKTYKIYMSDSKNGYPCFWLNNRNMLVHRFVMKAEKGQYVDHLYHDKYDCRKENLRIVSNQENACNRVLSKRSSTGYRNVYKINGVYVAVIHHLGIRYYCGRYLDIKDAAQAASNQRARLNMLDQGILPEIIPIEHKQLPRKF